MRIWVEQWYMQWQERGKETIINKTITFTLAMSPAIPPVRAKNVREGRESEKEDTMADQR